MQRAGQRLGPTVWEDGATSSNVPELDFYPFLSRMADMRAARAPPFCVFCLRLLDLLPT